MLRARVSLTLTLDDAAGESPAQIQARLADDLTLVLGPYADVDHLRMTVWDDDAVRARQEVGADAAV